MDRVEQQRNRGPVRLAARFLLFVLTLISVHAQAATIAAGRFHGVWVKDDGTVTAWGHNAGGQIGDGSYIDRSFPVPVSGLNGISATTGSPVIAGGLYHTLAVKTDGTVWAWGANNDGQIGDGTTYWRALPVKVPDLSGVIAIAAGNDHSVALKSDGTVWAWGRNDYGQVGDGTTTGRIVPVKVAGLSGVVRIAAGAAHSMALKADGTVWTWGNNERGQLGDSTATTRLAPVQVAGLTGIAGIAATYDHSVALKSDNSVWTWGDNTNGQLGDGSTNSRSLAARVNGVTGAVQVAAGGFATYARRLDGTVMAWGDNYFAQLGDGTTTRRNTPIVMPGIGNAAFVTAGTGHVAILRTDGSVSSAGQNVIGQLGDGSTVQAPAPIELASVTTIARLAPGETHSIALRADGTVVGWGENAYGQLGDGTYDSRGAPTPAAGVNNAIAVAAGTGFSLALRADGSVWAWGDNGYGQLGDGTFSARATPGPVPALTGVVAIAAGVNHAVVLRVDGTVWAWGGNAYGQLGDGTTTDRGVPTRALGVTGPAAIAAGGFHTMILRNDGTVSSWGRNDLGQLGDGTNENRTAPTTASGLTGVAAISGGTWHSMALKANGSVWDWGYNGTGQLGDGSYVNSNVPLQVSGASGVTAIAAGGLQSMALTVAGNVLAWGGGGIVGDGTDRDALYPTVLSFIGPVDRLAAAYNYTLALTKAGAVMGWGSNYSQKLGLQFPVQSATLVKTRDPQAAFAGSDLVVEFFNPIIKNAQGQQGMGHYFLTAVPEEAVSIDNGVSGAGWQRTGRTFRAWRPTVSGAAPASAPPGAVPVCRFRAAGPNSHFYTAYADECQSLIAGNPTQDASVSWKFEEISFYTVLPTANECPAGYYAIYRSYNKRFAQNDSNHRITPSVIDWLRSIYFLGYADEGVAFCAPANPDAVADLQAWYIYPGAEVQSGGQVQALFIFSNNGPGRGDGARAYVSLPPEVTNWSLCYNSSTDCAPAGDLNAMRSGEVITSWPAGLFVSVLATGTAPPVTGAANSTLNFAALVTGGSGTPDANRANNAPPTAQTLVKSAQACNYVVNPTSLSVGSAVQPVQVSVIAPAGCNWSVQNAIPWLGAAPAGGSGNGNVILTPQANTVGTARSGTVTIAGKSVAVTQAGVACSFTANPPSLTLSAGAQTAQVALNAVSGCVWTAQSSAPWLAVQPGTGHGAATLTITLAANAVTAARNGAITVGGLTIPVAQAGTAQAASAAPPPPDPCTTIRLQRDGDQMPAAGLSGDSSVAVLADSVCAWNSQSTAQWLTVTAGGSAKGNGTIRFSVQANPDPQLRIGTITVAGKAFTVTQQGREISTRDSGSDSGGDSSGGGGGSSGGGSGGSGGGGAG